MRFEISYSKGYGWHCGRPLLWLCLMVLGCAFAFVAVFLDAILRSATHLPIPWALCAPFAFLYFLRRRLLRKLKGEPFAVSPIGFFSDDMTMLFFHRGHRHFRALLLLEVLIWGSVIAAQLGIIVVYYVATKWPHH